MTHFVLPYRGADQISFSWEPVSEISILQMDITVYDISGNELLFQTTSDNSWEYVSESSDIVYKFRFTPHYDDNKEGVIYEVTRYICPNSFSTGLPRIDITTKDYLWPACDYVNPPDGCWGLGITNNSYVKKSILEMFDKNGSSVYTSNKVKIKIRGNTSATSNKKPYKIKLDSESDLIGLISDIDRSDKNYTHNEWLLLAKGTSINELIGFTIAKTVGLDYQSELVYVDLFINGDYQGIYLLCESISKGNGEGDNQSRIQVSDSGYIIESDAYWWNEDYYFKTNLPYPVGYTFKYPDFDPDEVDSSVVESIKNELKSRFLLVEYALSLGSDYCSELVDYNSFASWLLTHDYLGTYDSGGSNMYLTIYDDSTTAKIKMGPIWDLDTILNDNHISSFAIIHNASHFYYPQLLEIEGFRNIYDSLFNLSKDYC